MSNDTPTPMTDLFECENFPSTEPIVSAKRCRQLERRLTAAQAEIADLRAKCERLVNTARGCHDYGGGYRDADKAEIFHHGIQTVINAVEAASKSQGDTQANTLARIGAKAANKKGATP